MSPKAEPALEKQSVAASSREMKPVHFGRDIASDLAGAEQREWLVTNGIGGFASGTVAGNLTRRYHGLLFAALKPPLGRTLLVAKVDETAQYDGQSYPLATNRWAGAPSSLKASETLNPSISKVRRRSGALPVAMC